MRRAIALLVALAASAALVAGCSGGGLGEDTGVTLVPASQRKPAPAVSAPALDGQGRVTLAEHRGRPVVLNFWASWCEPCQKETPALVAFDKEGHPIDVVGIAVSNDRSDARAFARKEGVKYDLGDDPDAVVAGKFGVTGLPVTVVVDAQGRVATTVFGPVSSKDLESIADQLGT